MKSFYNSVLLLTLFAWTILANQEVSAQTNRALDFDGIDDWAEISHNSNMNFSTTMTVMLWVKTNDNRTAKVLEKETWNSGWTIDQDKWNGWQAGFKDISGNGHSIQWGQGLPVYGQWYHIAMTYDGSVLRLYVDGQLKNSKTISTSIKSNNEPVSLASDKGGQKFFSGSIDEVQLFNVALNQSQIQAVMDDYLNVDNMPAGINWTDLQGYWQFDEDTNSTSIFDESNYSNNGTLKNMIPQSDRIISTIFDSEDSNLPVNLVDFNASYNDGYVTINWSTNSEINNDYFSMEKSYDGINFFEIAVVEGAGNSNVLLNYSIVDNEIEGNVAYYRVKQYDFNGKYITSKIISVSLTRRYHTEIGLISIENSRMIINVNSESNQKVETTIFDLQGQILYTSSSDLKKGENNLEVVTNLNSSSYILSIKTTNFSFSKKIIVI